MHVHWWQQWGQDRDHNIPVQILKLDKTTTKLQKKRLKMTLSLLSPNMGFFVFFAILKKGRENSSCSFVGTSA